MFPETSGRTLEELTLRKLLVLCAGYVYIILMDTLTVYEGEQEAFMHGAETLHEHGENQTYGTMEGTCMVRPPYSRLKEGVYIRSSSLYELERVGDQSLEASIILAYVRTLCHVLDNIRVQVSLTQSTRCLRAWITKGIALEISLWAPH